MRHLGSLGSEENGNQLIEFLGLLPLIIMAGLIVFQLILAGQTISAANSAAREAARAATVCEDWYGAAVRASLGYDGNREVLPPTREGDMTVVRVRLRVPTLKIPYLETMMPWITGKGAVRREKCP